MDVVIDKTNDEKTVEIAKEPAGTAVDISIQTTKLAPPQRLPPAQPRKPPPFVPTRPAPVPTPVPTQVPTKDFFMDIANPSKVAARNTGFGSDFGTASTDDANEGETEEDEEGDDDGNGSLVGSDVQAQYQVDDPEDDEDDIDKPSPGFRTVDEEKSDIMIKLYRYKKNGVQVPRSFTMHSDIREMRSEIARIKADLDLEASVRFQRKCLVTVVSGIEFLNRRYDPFDVYLDGWSEQTSSSISDYDNVFARLHEKYKSKVQVAPELELLLMVAGSAMMFHVTHSLMKHLPAAFGGAAPGGGGLDPGMMAGVMANLMKTNPASQPPAATASQFQTSGADVDQHGSRPEMRPPSFDIGNMLGTVGVMPPPQIANPRAEAVASGSTKRPAQDEADDEDRLSDLVSVDGNELDSVPDDLTSIASGDAKVIPGGKGRGSRGGKKPKQTKSVIKI
jgi:hypothetical protein